MKVLLVFLPTLISLGFSIFIGTLNSSISDPILFLEQVLFTITSLITGQQAIIYLCKKHHYE